MSLFATVMIQKGLAQLGYYDGKYDGDAMGANFREDLRRFQADYGLTPDGWYGPKTEAKLEPLLEQLRLAPKRPALSGGGHLVRWTGTYYWIADQGMYKKGVDMVPVRTPQGKVLLEVEAAFFSAMALQGTGRLRSGQLLGVAGNPEDPKNPANLPCDPKVFAPCVAKAVANDWLPNKAGYAGVRVRNRGTAEKPVWEASHARCFDYKKVSANGWPAERLGIPLDPWKTIATDVGASHIARHDPKYKGKGGVVPSGTKVFILESVGWKLPDGGTHDGWWTANDTGGGIFGAHFDLFVGTPQLGKLNSVPHRLHIWFEGVENKLGMNYGYGL